MVTTAEAAETEAAQAVRIIETQNESLIAAAELALELARLDLLKYEKGEFPQQANKLQGQVELAREKLARSEENYEFMRRMSRKGYRTQNDVEAARIAVKQAELDLAAAEDELRVLNDYLKHRTMAELEAQAKELVNELARVKLQAAAELAKAQKLHETSLQKLEAERGILKKLREQIEACKLRAPQDGQVVYANLRRGRRSDGSGQIELGAEVRERQEIINLPDVTRMKVDCRVHESLITAVREGQRADVTIVSFPDEVFRGKVTSVSSVAMSGNWPNFDLREYRSEITLIDPVEKVSRLRPGLTAKVELLVDSRPDVLQVPIQSIVTIGRENFVYVVKDGFAERVPVRVGANNASHMEIVEGIEEGDLVVQNPQHAFAEELAALHADVKSNADSDDGPVIDPVDSVSPPADGRAPDREGQPGGPGRPEGRGGEGPPPGGNTPPDAGPGNSGSPTTGQNPPAQTRGARQTPDGATES